jgi:glutamyl-Q tRNA(Asp) synthetase
LFDSGYIGRFAPTPSGPLHFGSIIAALGSYLQARQHKGKWLVRIEDVDLPRTIPGADKIILEQLECLGLLWDGEVVYQSQQTPRYESALKNLDNLGLTFPCVCTRKEVANKPYPGTCRNGISKDPIGRSIRIKTNNQGILFNDLLQGDYSQSLEADVGDFVIKRTDGLFAYHLAVTVDDAEQEINEIVRGADLLDSTPRQIYLQQLLGFPVPRYLHLPIAINNDGSKVSKQSHAKAIDHNNPSKIICEALEFLGQSPPLEAVDSDLESLLSWSIKNWNINALPKQTEIKINTA